MSAKTKSAKTSFLSAAALAAALMAGAATAEAAVINFEEFAADDNNGAMPTNRYAAFGVTFNASDDGSTWGGNSNGNPGNWGLEGTNGAQFMGFNGSSYGLSMNFAGAITGFSLDASRSNGSSNGSSLLVEGYLGANLVDSVSLNFGDINSWATFALNGVIDRVVLLGSGNSFHPYGVDNIVWDRAAAVPEPAAAALFGLGLLGLGVARRKRFA